MFRAVYNHESGQRVIVELSGFLGRAYSRDYFGAWHVMRSEEEVVAFSCGTMSALEALGFEQISTSE